MVLAVINCGNNMGFSQKKYWVIHGSLIESLRIVIIKILDKHL